MGITISALDGIVLCVAAFTIGFILGLALYYAIPEMIQWVRKFKI